MAKFGVVPPGPGHAPAVSRLSLAPHVRVALGVFAILCLAIGSAGYIVYAHWLFVAVAVLGFVVGVLLLPHALPVLWGGPKQ